MLKHMELLEVLLVWVVFLPRRSAQSGNQRYLGRSPLAYRASLLGAAVEAKTKLSKLEPLPVKCA